MKKMQKMFKSMMGQNQPVTNEQISPMGQGTSSNNESVTEELFEVIQPEEEEASSSQESPVIINREDIETEPASDEEDEEEEEVIPMKPVNPVNPHPWSGFYEFSSQEPYEGWNALYLNYTLEQAQLFRHTSETVWAQEPRRELEMILGKRDVKTSDKVPNGPFAFYSVIAKFGKILVLTPLFNEIVAHDRLDLRLVHINHNALDTLNEGLFDPEEHPIGDILCVTKLQRKRRYEGLRIPNFTPQGVSTPKGNHFWEVAEYHFTPRRIEHKVITAPFKQMQHKYLCVASGFREVIEMPRTPERGLDEMLVATIFVPAMEPGQFLPNLRKVALLSMSQISPKIVTWNTYSPLVLYAESAPSYVLTMFSVYSEAFKYIENRDEAYLALKTAVEFGANGLLAIKDSVVDKNTYLAKTSDIFVQWPYIYFTFTIIGASSPPLEHKWNRAADVNIECEGTSRFYVAEILSAKTNYYELVVEARISMRSMSLAKFQRLACQDLFITQRVEKDFLEIDFDVEEGSNADKLIQALYGGEPLPEVVLPPSAEQHLTIGKLRLLETQTRYAHMVADEKTIALIGSSSFGCGKTAAIAAAALHAFKKNPEKFQMITAITNSAVVAVIEKLVQLDPRVKIVRIISTSNSNNLPSDQLSQFDLPNVINSIFSELIIAEDERCSKEEPLATSEDLLKQIIWYSRRHRHLSEESLQSEKMTKLYRSASSYDEETILEFYMKMEKPSIIVGTVQTVFNAFGVVWQSYIKNVATIQIDEASTLPRETLLRLVTLFPDARYSLVGDYRQLSPYYESDASPLLINTAVSDTLQQCVSKNLLPSVFFSGVFRCRAEITELLGTLFYSSALTSLHIKSRTEHQMANCPAWRLGCDNEYPLIFIDTYKTKHAYVGTSLKNHAESKLVMSLVRHLLNYVESEDIAILCFYRAQMLDMRNFGEHNGVYVGSVDSAQGREWPICIVCTTRTGSLGVGDFLTNANRVNVALSRSKHMTYIFGDVQSLYNKGKWNIIIDKCEKENTLQNISEFHRITQKL